MAEAVAAFVIIAGLLGEPGFVEGVEWIARAADGEVGGVLGDQTEQAQEWIVHTILNRLHSSAYPNDPEEVVRGSFYGWTHSDVSSASYHRAYLLTLKVVINRSLLKHAPTDGWYMFSLQDLEKFGVEMRADRCFIEGVYGLCFFKEYPIEEKQP